MKTTEVTEELIGKRCKSIFTAMMVTGTIEEININKYSAEVKVRFDEPQNWGGELYNHSWSSARLCDEFGSLNHLEIIDDLYQTVKITLSKSIQEVNKMFSPYDVWGVVNLKEWIDNYETTRFTQIGERSAIITSEYNLECVREWLAKNTPIETIE